MGLVLCMSTEWCAVVGSLMVGTKNESEVTDTRLLAIPFENRLLEKGKLPRMMVFALWNFTHMINPNPVKKSMAVLFPVTGVDSPPPSPLLVISRNLLG